jgi:hypothetical protein
MRHKNHHLSDKLLLRAGDLELSPWREAQILAHLAGCAACRERRDKLQSLISDFSRAHREEFSQELPSIAGSRAALQAKLAAMPTGSQRSGWRDQLANLFVGNRWAYVAVVFVVAALGLRQISPDMVRRYSRPLLAAAGSGPLLPQPGLTPGATRPINTSQVCTPGPSDQMATIPMTVRQAVFHEYGMDGSQPREFEVDHLITPELGGTDDIRNLWPEPYATTEWNAHVKDELENHLRQLVCDGKLDLPTAQRDIATNWISAYQKYFHTDKPLSDVSIVRWAQERKPIDDARLQFALLAPMALR